eukprot:TRINITY_DN34740_c0_g1_i1.p2 TRINITY_DN34740_c0_g1~~TRINITY_DN34740_c0_g1_i1.p2  ORF type:complete len:104 (+),score=14.30 TRINITY_DN34740_c0_g1_i1:126-437(+)
MRFTVIVFLTCLFSLNVAYLGNNPFFAFPDFVSPGVRQNGLFREIRALFSDNNNFPVNGPIQPVPPLFQDVIDQFIFYGGAKGVISESEEVTTDIVQDITSLA